MTSTADSCIREFIANYRREFYYHQEAARICQIKCEELLRKHSIRAIVTARAKNPDKLQKKLHERNSRKGRDYSSINKIRDDIPDLSGVRIALYFPGQRELVAQILDRYFVVTSTPRLFPDPKDDTAGSAVYSKIFSGYHAQHFRLKLRAEHATEGQGMFLDALIEVQLGSILMHAWAEIEHDLIYKPVYDSPAEEEHAILDELNGLVLAGEVALRRLQFAIERRVTAKKGNFENHYDLGSFLTQWVRNKTPTFGSALGDVEALWKLLLKGNLKSKESIQKYLDATNIDNQSDNIALLLRETIINDNPNLSDVTLSGRKDIQAFLAEWGQFKTAINEIARRKNNTYVLQRYQSSPTGLRIIASQIGFSVEEIDGLLGFDQLRNFWTSDQTPLPSEEGVARTRATLREKMLQLRNHHDVDVRMAIGATGDLS